MTLLPFILFWMLAIRLVHGEAVRVTWAANPEPDIAAYVVSLDAGGETIAHRTEATAAIIDGLAAGETYSVRLYAFNTAGMSSEPSDPVSYHVPAEEPTRRLRITLYSAETPDRRDRREEARFFQPIDGPRRFWWAEIETP